MHYLMEKRQEQEFNDPFELLKSMNDVMMAYEPVKKKLTSNIDQDTLTTLNNDDQVEFFK